MPKQEFKIEPASLTDVGFFICRLYEDDEQLQRYSRMDIPEGQQLLGFYRKQERGRCLGIIGISRQSSLYTIVHEATHAALHVARYTGKIKELGWSREYWEVEEEEEWLAGLLEEIVEGIRRMKRKAA